MTDLERNEAISTVRNLAREGWFVLADGDEARISHVAKDESREAAGPLAMEAMGGVWELMRNAEGLSALVLSIVRTFGHGADKAIFEDALPRALACFEVEPVETSEGEDAQMRTCDVVSALSMAWAAAYAPSWCDREVR